jgi:hypothetical protein
MIHGFHIHAYGDISATDGTAAGGTYLQLCTMNDKSLTCIEGTTILTIPYTHVHPRWSVTLVIWEISKTTKMTHLRVRPRILVVFLIL